MDDLAYEVIFANKPCPISRDPFMILRASAFALGLDKVPGTYTL